jgi:hypothetical protein
MKDANLPENKDHNRVTNDESSNVIKNHKAFDSNIQVHDSGNHSTAEDVQSEKSQDNIQKHAAPLKTKYTKSYKPRFKRTDFPLVKYDEITQHDTVVKCKPSDVNHTTSLIESIPQPFFPTVRYTAGEKYLHSDSSSTLSSAWDIELDLGNENSEQDKAPLAQFRRWHKDFQFCKKFYDERFSS